MKKTGFIVFLLLFTVLASAQQTTTLVQVLERDIPGKGQIRVERDERLDSLIGTVSEAHTGTKIKAKGYRIQVFAGNNTRASKERANEVDRYIRAGEIDDEETKAKIDRMHRLNLYKLSMMPAFDPCLSTIE